MRIEASLRTPVGRMIPAADSWAPRRAGRLGLAAAKLFNVEIFVQLFGVRYAAQKQLVPIFHG
jgi:hypothetical protein